MLIHAAKPLLPRDELEVSPTLATIGDALQAIPDARRLAALNRRQHNGGDAYPVSARWGVLLLSVILRHTTTEAGLEELRSNAPLRSLVGIESEDAVPDGWNRTRFLAALGQAPSLDLLRDSSNAMAQRLGVAVTDLGRHTAGDSTGRCGRREPNAARAKAEIEDGLPQASGGRKEYQGDDGKVAEAVEWFGDELHLLVDVTHAVVSSCHLTDTKAGDNACVEAPVEQARGNVPADRIRASADDKAADDVKVHEARQPPPPAAAAARPAALGHQHEKERLSLVATLGVVMPLPPLRGVLSCAPAAPRSGGRLVATPSVATRKHSRRDEKGDGNSLTRRRLDSRAAVGSKPTRPAFPGPGACTVNVAVVGTGYVGLVTGTCLAETGNAVTCVDNNPDKLALLERGGIPIFEPGLDVLVQKNRAAGRLAFTGDLAAAVRGARLVFVAVGTPELPSGEADLKYVNAVVDGICAALKGLPKGEPGERVIVLKSTVPPGTNRAVTARMAANGCAHVDVASNPEFLKEGAAIEDFMTPDRVVVGVRHPAAGEALRELYGPYCTPERPFLVMSPESAEMTKYAANAMLATKISFINEVANLCDATGADVNAVRNGIGHDQRIGFQFLAPGPGYGGSCFPKDVKGLIAVAKALGVTLRVSEAVDAANDAQKEVLFAKVNRHFGGNLRGKAFAVWGLAFKPKTDDIREAPALTLIDALLAAGARVRAFDPEAVANARAAYGDKLYYAADPLAALDGAAALVLVTEWPEFRTPDFAEVKRRLAAPVIFDGRNLYANVEDEIRDLGFTYYGIGRGR